MIDRKIILNQIGLKLVVVLLRTPKNKSLKLIKETDSHLIKCGDAIISEKHCNFFVNKGSAKSSDIEQLISEVRENVFKKTA